MPDELSLSYILIMLLEPGLSFLWWLGTKSWTVPFLLSKVFLKPSVDSDFKMILNARPSSGIGFACTIRSQSLFQHIKLGYFLDTPR